MHRPPFRNSPLDDGGRPRYRAALTGRSGNNGGSQPAQSSRPRSFLIGTQDVVEGGDYDQTFTNTAGGSLQPWTLQATGWLARLWMRIDYTTTAGTLTADSPFIIFSSVQLNDVNNEAIFGPFDGYTWFLTNKYGGYYFVDDPSFNAVYTVTGTAGTFIMQVPLEIVNRDPIGDLASVNNTATLTLIMQLNAAATAFPSATAWSVRVRGTQEFYWEPRKSDKQGRTIAGAPPAAGTTQYWTQGSIPIAAAGTINNQLITGLGYPFRNYLFMYRGTGGARSSGETNWPDPLIGIKFEANFLVTQYTKGDWQGDMSRTYGHTNAAFDTRGPLGTGAASNLGSGKENGVYGLAFNQDFFLQRPGGETRRGYLVTSPGSNFIINAAMGVAGNLYSIVNYVAPGGGGGASNAQPRHQDTAMLTGGQ
jgi:hypothetical protein